MQEELMVLLYILLPLAGGFLGWIARWLYAKMQLTSAEQRAQRILTEAQKQAEAQKKEMLVEAKDQIIRERNQQERENREWRAEIQRYERRLIQKEENLDKKIEMIERQEQSLQDRIKALAQKEAVLANQEAEYMKKLEHVAQMNQQDAKALLIQTMESEAKRDAQALINKIEQKSQLNSEKRAREILVTTIQRLATEVTNEVTITSVNLPNDEMKGRIIGREGRNIRTLETLIGVDIIVDDTPEAVVISSFDPVRREIARIVLERLIIDGRIHPARIEEVVQKVNKEISQKIFEEGEKVVFDLGIHNMNPELIRALGRLYFRTSYGQN
ncbi:MAG TPA: Rnase Y domain-containing protein, partial [Spirochaetales bacterium]|nr:Rnase Y domain-containing protein [Spirochaetales bacterium]